jgi:hypothetical protein
MYSPVTFEALHTRSDQDRCPHTAKVSGKRGKVTRHRTDPPTVQRWGTRPRLRDPESADRWTWLVIAVHTQLRLARSLVTDLRRPWERPAESTRFTPARVRRGFRNIHTKTARPAAAPKPTRPGPGRPPGSKNRVAAQRFDVGRILATGQAYTRPTHHKKNHAEPLNNKLKTRVPRERRR